MTLAKRVTVKRAGAAVTKAAKAKPVSMDDYIAAAPPIAQPHLHAMRAAIRKAAPDATEGLKWSMPAFSQGRILVTFAWHAQHLGFYPTPSAVEAFADKLTRYTTSKGGIQFPYDSPLPAPLIAKIVAFRVKELTTQDRKWRS